VKIRGYCLYALARGQMKLETSHRAAPQRTIHEVTFMKLKKSPRISTDFPRIYTD